MNKRSPRARSGFSLIEVLIATTVLLVIMVLVSMVFQQSSGAFRDGRGKVEAQNALRTALGTVTRDLAMAVVDPDNAWNGNSITFCVPTKESTDLITYSFSGGTLRRNVEGGASAIVVEGLVDFFFTFEPAKPADGTLPTRIDIVATAAEAAGSSSYVGIQSWGPDGKEGTEDDLWVGRKVK